MTPEELRADILRRQIAARQAVQISTAEQAERDRMIAIAERRQRLGAEVEGVNPGEGLTLDPRTGTYKNRQALAGQYEPTRVDAAVGGGMQGTALQFGDEVIGALGALEGPGMGPVRREQARGRLERQQDAFPYTFGGSELAGNVLTAAAALPLAQGTTGMQTVGRGIALGGAEGSAIGVGAGEGLEDRLKKGIGYGGVGAAVGGAAPVVIGAGAKALGGVWDAARGLVGSGNQSRARRSIIEMLSKAGVSPDDATRRISQAATEGQPEYRLMDAAGDAGRRRASGVVRSGGDGSEELSQFLQQRQIDAPDRMGGFVDDAFGTRGTTAEQTKTGLMDARKATADIDYDLARGNSAPVDVTPVVDDINALLRSNSSLDGGKTGLKDTAIGKRLERIGSQLSDGNYQAIDFDDVLETKMEMGRALEVMKRSGAVPPAFSKVYRQLDSALESSSDMYRKANDTYRDASRVIKSVDRGADMAKRGRAADTVPAFQSMTPDQQGAARIGYGDNLLQRIEGTAAEAPNVSRQMASTKRKVEADAMAINPSLYRDRIGREADMFKTFDRAKGGSLTADNLGDIADVGVLADMGRAAVDTARGNYGGALGNIGGSLKNIATGQNEGTRTQIARILMSSNPEQELEKALRSQNTNLATKRIIEAMLRNTTRDPVYSSVPR